MLSLSISHTFFSILTEGRITLCFGHTLIHYFLSLPTNSENYPSHREITFSFQNIFLLHFFFSFFILCLFFSFSSFFFGLAADNSPLFYALPNKHFNGLYFVLNPLCNLDFFYYIFLAYFRLICFFFCRYTDGKWWSGQK